MWRGGVCNMRLLLTPFILGFALALPSQEKPAPRPNCIRMTLEKERQIDQIVEKLGNFLNNLTIEHEHFDIRLIKLSIEQHTEDEVEEKETVLQLAVNDCKLSDDELEEIDHHREKAKQHEKEREAQEAEKLKQERQLADAHGQKSDNSQNKQETQENSGNSDAPQTKEETSKNEQETKTNNEHSDVHEQKDTKSLKNEQGRKQSNKKTVVNENADETSNNEHENKDTDDKPIHNNLTEAEELKNNAEGAKSGKHFEVMYLDLDENGQKLVEAMGKKKKSPRIVYVQERNSGQTEYWFLKRR